METPDSAANKILNDISVLPVERIPLTDALDLILAEDMVSPVNLPHWDNSAMDGYAVRSRDLTQDAPCELEIIEEIPAGAFPRCELAAGQCARIFTGAPIPRGADTVIRQEDTTRRDETHVVIEDLRDVGRNVRPMAEDVREGETVLSAGTQLGPAELGMLAAIAQFDAPVFRRPVVAILGSGDEIADVDERDAILEGRKIATSNTYTLVSLIKRAGAEPLNLGVAKDDPEDVQRRILDAKNADLIVTTAGVSVGEHDFLHQVLEQLEVKRRFWRISMRPGAPVAFGLIGALEGLPWIGLPGNPVSTMVTFELFARPAIRKMLGHTLLFRHLTPVTVGEAVTLGPPLRHFLRVKLSGGGDGVDQSAHLTGAQGSGVLSSMVLADALMIVREDKAQLDVGEKLSAIVLNDPRHVEQCPW